MRSSNLALLVAAACIVLPQVAVASEVVTLKLRKGVSYADFAPVDKAVETQHVSKQPGFMSRESAAGESGDWLVIVHWWAAKDADVMASFASVPAAQEFMAKIDASSLAMKRYGEP